MLLIIVVLLSLSSVYSNKLSVVTSNDDTTISEIKRYTIFGERSSGTKYLGTHLQSIIITTTTITITTATTATTTIITIITTIIITNLEELITTNLNVTLTWDYGYKHFFGYNEYNKNKSIAVRMPVGYNYHHLNNNSNDVLFIGIIRHPLQWLAAFKSKPDHVYMNNTLSWNNFMFNEWISIYDKAHHKLDNFYNKEIMSDRHIYTGQRYKNIFELRRTKTKYLLDDIVNKVKHYYFVRFEDVQNRSVDIIHDIANSFNITIKNISNIITKFSYYSAVRKQALDSHHLDKDIEEIAKANLDLEIEKRCNYIFTY
jgi:hypothetical protein